jgi:hypothetical protein
MAAHPALLIGLQPKNGLKPDNRLKPDFSVAKANAVGL